MHENTVARLSLVAILTSILTITGAASAQDKDLSGRWTGTFNGKGRPATLVLKLRVSDNQVTGELVDPHGNQMPIRNWKLEGNQLTFDASAKEHGRPRTDHFVGVVEDDLIKLLEHNNQKHEPPITFRRNQE